MWNTSQDNQKEEFSLKKQNLASLLFETKKGSNLEIYEIIYGGQNNDKN